MAYKHKILVLTGPSGSGKDTLIANIVKNNTNYQYPYLPVGYGTTRMPRSLISLNDLKDKLNEIKNWTYEDITKAKQTINPTFLSYHLSLNEFTKNVNELIMQLQNATSIDEYLKSFNAKDEHDLYLKIHNDDTLRAIIHLNTENPYINWLDIQDVINEVRIADDLASIKIKDDYYVQSILDVNNRNKNNIVIINATPNTWARIKGILEYYELEPIFMWIDANETQTKNRMLNRKDSLENIEFRIKNDKLIWNQGMLDKVVKEFNCIVIDGNGNENATYTNFLNEVYSLSQADSKYETKNETLTTKAWAK